MKGQVFIRFESDPQCVAWQRVAAGEGETGSGRGRLDELADVLAGQRVVVFAPGTEVVLTKVAVPAKKRRQLLQAVPYLLEDHFAADVEDLHFALGDVTAGEAAVAVVSRSVLDDWLAPVQALGADVSAVIPEYLALPLEDAAWTVLRSGDQVVVRQGGQAGLAIDAENLADVLAIMLEEAGDNRPEKLRVYDFDTPPLALDEAGVAVETVSTPGHPLDVMMAGYRADQAFNLLQGEYSQSERLGRLWRPWRPALALAGSLLVLQFGSTVLDLVQLGNERQRLSDEVSSIYRETFPDERNVPNPRVQMERHLSVLRSGGGGGEGGFADLLTKAGREFKDMPQFHLQRLSYKEGSLDVALLINDLQQLDVLKKRLIDNGGLAVDIQSAASRGEQVEARLKISERAS